MRRFVATALACLVPASFANAWSTKEHIQITRLAASGLIADPTVPDDMKAWLKDAAPGLLTEEQEKDYYMNERMGIVPHGVDGLMYWAVMPDMNTLMDLRKKKIPPLNVPEGPMHYFELEFYTANPPSTDDDTKPKAGDKELIGDAANPPTERSRKAVKPDPANKPAFDSIKRDPTDKRLSTGGALPYRVAQCYSDMVAAIRDNRLVDKPGQFPRDEHAAHWAGFIAHYVQDSTQPLHTTWDYKSRAYFPAGTKAPDVHAVMEYVLCDDEKNDYMDLRAAFWPKFQADLKDAKEIADSKDPWTASLQACYMSYDALPLIGEAAVASWDKDAKADKPEDQGVIDVEKFYNFRGKYMGKEMSVLEMKAFQQAWAVKRTQNIWLQAWNEAKGTAAPVGPAGHVGP